jgi:hypothetical protein
VPCTYSQIGEINGNLAGLLATQEGVTTPFKVHSDSAPNIYITENPARDNQTVTRPFEQALGKLSELNPITGNTDQLAQYMADPVEMKLLHMVTADPARTPTLTMFANPDYFLYAGAPNCNSACLAVEPGFAWNHGDVSPDINTTWLGLVGPGVRNVGTTGYLWSDHTDIRPTMLTLLGLKDDYQSDGRVLTEVLDRRALPHSLRASERRFRELARIYKQIEAPVGELGLDTLAASTRALESQSSGDTTYTGIENKISQMTDQRNAVGAEMAAALNDAEFNGKPIRQDEARELIERGWRLLEAARHLASQH